MTTADSFPPTRARCAIGLIVPRLSEVRRASRGRMLRRAVSAIVVRRAVGG